MIKRLKTIGISHIKTVSNGMLLNETISEKLVRSGLDAIEISLDGRTIEENDQIRSGSDAKKIIHNIKRLLELKKQFNSYIYMFNSI
jgi:molybdenum cofactor biosynthesis enzyme MoaA